MEETGNVLAVQALRQAVGNRVLTLPDGRSVARIPAGETFTSEWQQIAVPSAAPDAVTLAAEIDRVHYHLGRTDGTSMGGLTSRKDLDLVSTAYKGAVTGVTPERAYEARDFEITGRALERATGSAMANVPLTLVVRRDGFERTFEVYTDSQGAFSHTFSPLANESGVYDVSAVHPDVVDRPDQARFVISRVFAGPRQVNLTTIRDRAETVPIKVETGPGTAATNLHLEYVEADQPSGAFLPGLTVDPGDTLDLAARERGRIDLGFEATSEAPDTGQAVLRLVSDESGARVLAKVTVAFELVAAQPNLTHSPGFIETGVAQGGSVRETLTLENQGLAPQGDVSLALLDKASGALAPDWVRLATASQLGEVPVGAAEEVRLRAEPDSTVAEGIHRFLLRVMSGGTKILDIPVSVAVTLDGKGAALFKLSDIYTGTTDDQGDIVPGLQGATIELQNENVLSVQREATTDSLGEVLFEGLPAGTYRYRASADNHQAKSGSFRVRAGITGTQEVFLDYNLVTVEWSVTEVTVEDRYEITLDATYETEVPAAVVSVEPAAVNLPAMAPGDVYNGELVITNQGLIRADNFELTIPADGTHYRYELMGGLPGSLEAGETIRVPYRVTALQEIAPDGSGSGGGCSTYQHCGGITYDHECANGTTASGGAAMCWFYAPTNCGGPSPGDPGHGEPGDIPDVYTPPSPGGGSDPGGGGGAPSYQPIGGSDNSCPGDCPDKGCACNAGGGGGGSGGPGGGGGGCGGGLCEF